MKKILFLFFLIIQSIFSITTKEDLEILELKKQIASIEKKIKKLEYEKNITINNKKNLKIGVALSGGGAKGLAHIGVLRALEEANIHIDYITGTSMGAIVGSLYATGYSTDEIEKILTNPEWEGLINGSYVNENIPLEKKVNSKKYMLNVKYDNKFNFSLPKGIGNNQLMYFELKKLLHKVENTKDFNKYKIPIRIVATDLNTGKAVAFDSGDLARAVTASAAIPTIFEPIDIDGNLYVDGMVARNFPVSEAYDMGADIVIGSDVGSELKFKNNYNILTIFNQLLTLQSVSNSIEQQNLATILIEPKVKGYSPTDLNNSETIINLGYEETKSHLQEIIKIVNPQSSVTKSNIDDTSQDKVFISKIIYVNEISEKDKRIIDNIFSNILYKESSFEEIESYIFKAYSNSLVDKIYYEIQGTSLVLNITLNPSNSFGAGFKYMSGYGTTLDIGTTLSQFGKLGNNTLANVQIGDYFGINLKNFTYYGLSNKIGIFTNIGYNESPFFIYDNKSKVANYTSTVTNLETGLLVQYNNSLMAEYGFNFSYIELKQETGPSITKKLEYSNNFSGAFFRIGYDSLNSDTYPTSGVKSTLDYSWEGNFERSNSQLYGSTYTLEHYISFKKNFTFYYGFNSGVLNGDTVQSPNKYFKIGSTKNNMKNREFAFYGYAYQEKLVDKFFIANINLRYKIDSNIYLKFGWNLGTFSNYHIIPSEEHHMWKHYEQGFSIGVNYDSIIGPIEFSISKDSVKKDIISQITIGYIFN